MLHRRDLSLPALPLSAAVAAFAQGQAPMTHIVLLGDSIFDNGRLCGRARLTWCASSARSSPPAGAPTLNALDGAVIADVPQQLHKLARDATHLVLSAGGNHALSESGLLERK
jgi:hypothetical protein